VIMPQAFKRIIPPLGNEFIAMLKDLHWFLLLGLKNLRVVVS
jgi:ABC-type amino acid transport system, permease component